MCIGTQRAREFYFLHEESRALKHTVFCLVLDPRCKDLFLIRSPLTLISILAGYVYFVTKWGPQFMRKRRALDLRKTMMIYNIAQIIMNVAIFCEVRTGKSNIISTVSIKPTNHLSTFVTLFSNKFTHFPSLDSGAYVIQK